MPGSVIRAGVTGFWNFAEAALEKVDFKEQREAAVSIACSDGNWRKVTLAPRTEFAKFPRFHVDLGQSVVDVLIHDHVRIAACVCQAWNASEPDWTAPAGTDQLSCRMLGWELIAPEVLGVTPPRHLIETLPVCEREQVRYWKPETVGAVAFNIWD